jgi:ribonuclease VapC
MVVDTSALLAALFAERHRDVMLVVLAEAASTICSSCCMLEGSIVATSRLGPQGCAELERLIDTLGIEIVPFTPPQAELARDAWERYGKGRPAGLNIVDCCSYALARHSRRPLLAVGMDFSRTDLELVALPW